MSKPMRSVLRLITLYAQIEIASGLLLIMLFWGYLGFSTHRSDYRPVALGTSPTLSE